MRTENFHQPGVVVNGRKIAAGDAGPPVEVAQQPTDDVYVDGLGRSGKFGDGGFLRIGDGVAIKRYDPFFDNRLVQLVLVPGHVQIFERVSVAGRRAGDVQGDLIRLGLFGKEFGPEFGEWHGG